MAGVRGNHPPTPDLRFGLLPRAWMWLSLLVLALGAACAAAPDVGPGMPVGPNLIPTMPWGTAEEAGAKQQVTTDAVGVKVAILATGTATRHLQTALTRPLPAGDYELRFRARADRPLRVIVRATESQEPWPAVGLEEEVPLDVAWRDFHFQFHCSGGPSILIPHLTYGDQRGTFWFQQFLLRKLAPAAAADGVNLMAPLRPADWTIQATAGDLNLRMDGDALRAENLLARPSDYDAVFYQTAAGLPPGHYRLEASLRADRARRAGITLQGVYRPYPLPLGETVRVGTEWQKYTADFDLPPVPGLALQAPKFLVGRDQGVLWIKDLRLTRLGEAPPDEVVTAPSNPSGPLTVRATPPAAPFGAIGFGGRSGTVEFQDVRVTGPDGRNLLDWKAEPPAGWHVLRGQWTLAGGVARLTAENPDAAALLGDPDWTDYTVTLKARATSGKEGPRIFFRARDDMHFYRWSLGGTGNSLHVIDKADGAPAHFFLGAAGRIDLNRWYDVRIQMEGARVRCFLDGALVHDFVDPPPVDLENVEVPATASLYRAGKRGFPAPGSGTPPLEFVLPPGPDRVILVNGVSGEIRLANNVPANGPDGGASFNRTQVEPYHGLSGITHFTRTGFLCGVFLTDQAPTYPAPARLDFSPTALGTEFRALAPELAQVFFVGDGRNGKGEVQAFIPPVGATRLLLGFADAYRTSEFALPVRGAVQSGFIAGTPGFYDDNLGALHTGVLSVPDATVGKGVVPPGPTAHLGLMPDGARPLLLGLGDLPGMRLQLAAARPAFVKREPVYRRRARYAVLGIGDEKITVVADEDETLTQNALYVDANGDGDLTNDPPVFCGTPTAGPGRSRDYEARVWIYLRGHPVVLRLRRSSREPGVLQVSPEWAQEGSVRLGDRSYAVALWGYAGWRDLLAPGNGNPPADLPAAHLLIDLDGDGTYSASEQFDLPVGVRANGAAWEIAAPPAGSAELVFRPAAGAPTQ